MESTDGREGARVDCSLCFDGESRSVPATFVYFYCFFLSSKKDFHLNDVGMESYLLRQR